MALTIKRTEKYECEGQVFDTLEALDTYLLSQGAGTYSVHPIICTIVEED
jgi:hypothetical protein